MDGQAWQALAAHVAGALRQVAGGGTGCGPGEPDWLAPACRWDPVALELAKTIRADPGAARHRRSGQWEQPYGRAIPGGSCAAQLAAVRAWRPALAAGLNAAFTRARWALAYLAPPAAAGAAR